MQSNIHKYSAEQYVQFYEKVTYSVDNIPSDYGSRFKVPIPGDRASVYDWLESCREPDYYIVGDELCFLDSWVASWIRLEFGLPQEKRDKMDIDAEEFDFVFEDLVDCDDRGIQLLLREVQSDNLVVALKGASEELKDKIYKNMSHRAADMLREEFATRGPVKLSECEYFQNEIVTILHRLMDEGQVSFDPVEVGNGPSPSAILAYEYTLMQNLLIKIANCPDTTTLDSIRIPAQVTVAGLKGEPYAVAKFKMLK